MGLLQNIRNLVSGINPFDDDEKKRQQFQLPQFNAPKLPSFNQIQNQAGQTFRNFTMPNPQRSVTQPGGQGLVQKAFTPQIRQAIQQVPRTFVTGVNTIGKTIGNQPLLNTPHVPFVRNQPPTIKIKQPFQAVAPNSFMSNLFRGDVNSGVNQLNKQFGNFNTGLNKITSPNQNERVEGINAALGGITFAGVAKPSYQKAADYLRVNADKNAISKIRDFVVRVENKGERVGLTDIGADIQAIANDVFGAGARKLTNKQLANAFDATLKQIGRKPNNFALGLAVDDIRSTGGGSKLKLKLSGSKQKQPDLSGVQDDLLETGVQGGKLQSKTQQPLSSGGSKLQEKPTLSGQQSDVSLPGIVPEKQFNININRLKTTKKGQSKIRNIVKDMEPVLKKNKGKPLSNEEVLEGGRKALLLGDVMERSQSKKFAESLQATRNFIKTESKKPGVTPKFLEQLEIMSSHAADAGRRLRSFGIDAEDTSVKAQVLKELMQLEVDTKDILKAAKKVNWNNADDVTRFYRQFKPASFLEKLEEYRYVNMLSSPNTQIVNNFSNFIQTGLVAPVEKTIAGQVDWIANKLTGRERQYFASQGIDYTKAYYKTLPKAFSELKRVMGGSSGLTKPDIDFLPTSTSKLSKAYTTPLRALEASDRFFRTLAEAGELKALQKSNLSPAQAAKKARDTAAYRIFRQEFDPEGKLGQNIVLQTWDKWNSAISNMRRVPGGRWIVPFLQTPTNILKQGVEFSPLGFSTVPGSKEPIVQLSRALIGTGVFSAAYGVAEAGLTTWDTPINRKEKDAFYAAGLQPYSVKIGDNWVSYSKLGPLSYPIAMAAAMKWAKDNGADNNFMQTIGSGMGGVMQFFADQSYVRGIGDYIDALRGDDYKIERAFSNIPAQLVPYRSFLGWVTRMVDPVYRKVSNPIEAITTQIPGLSTLSEPYKTPFGEDSPRDYPIVNAFSPLRVSKEKDKGVRLFNQLNDIRRTKQGMTFIPGPNNTGGTFSGSKADAESTDLAPIMWVDDSGTTQTVNLTKKEKVKDGSFKSYKEDTNELSDAVKIYHADNNQVTREQKLKAYKKLGYSEDDIRYHARASFLNSEEQAKYYSDNFKDHEKLFEELVKGRRKSVGGEYLANDGTLDELYKEGKISYAERKYLKSLKTDKKGNPIAGSGKGGGGRGRKPKKITYGALPKPGGNSFREYYKSAKGGQGKQSYKKLTLRDLQALAKSKKKV
jgi:hypothetical protein